MIRLADATLDLPADPQCLLLAPGAFGMDWIIRCLDVDEGKTRWSFLYAGSLTQGIMGVPWANWKARPSFFFRSALARLPFRRHAFHAVFAIECLRAATPPWTALAEIHRVLAPEGRLVLAEPPPGALEFFARPRFSPDEIQRRLARADFLIESVREIAAPPAYLFQAIKKENPAEPVPQFTTGRELRARQKKYPRGDQLP